MPRLFPFRGCRFSRDHAQSLNLLVTQPYDKISPQLQRDYLSRHPHNVVRVIKNRDYEQAGRCLKNWIDEGVLIKDPVPALYPYRQTFEFEGATLSRLGIMGLVSLDDAGSILGHEGVLDDPLQDRLNLMRRTEANPESIFMLYGDAPGSVSAILSEVLAESVLIEVQDDDGVTHRVWRVEREEVQNQIREAIEKDSFLVADGHHRLETSLRFCRECRARGWKPAAVESFDKRLATLFGMEDEGLKILATHRGIRDLPGLDVGRMIAALQGHFTVREVSGPRELDLAMKEDGRSIGVYSGDSARLLLPREAAPGRSFMPSVKGPARELAVNILHQGILEPVLGIGAEKISAQTHVDYFRHRRDLYRSVEEKRHQVGFLLNPPTVEQIRTLSERGERMPQKSTDFYPKLLTGLVMMKMEIEK